MTSGCCCTASSASAILVVFLAFMVTGRSTATLVPSSLGNLFIVHDGKPLTNNSLVRVPEGESVTMTCVMTEDRSGGGAALTTDYFATSGEEVGGGREVTWHYRWLEARTKKLVSASQTVVIPQDLASKSASKRQQDGGALPDRLLCAASLQQVSNLKDLLLNHVAVDLKPIAPPSFTIRRVPAFGIPVIEGMTVILSCDIEVDAEDTSVDHADISPRWMKDEVPLNRSGHPAAAEDDLARNGDSSAKNGVGVGAVTFIKVTMDDIGWYQCYTKLNTGEIYSSIGYFLNVQPLPDDVEDEEGTTVPQGDAGATIRDGAAPPSSASSSSSSSTAHLKSAAPAAAERRRGGHQEPRPEAKAEANVQVLDRGKVFYEEGNNRLTMMSFPPWNDNNVFKNHTLTPASPSGKGHGDDDGLDGGNKDKDVAGGRCSGCHGGLCCDLYFGTRDPQFRVHQQPVRTGPLVRALNQTTARVARGQDATLAVEVCSNPRAHRVFWVTPTSVAVTAGGPPVAKYLAKDVVTDRTRITCVLAELLVKDVGHQDAGEYLVVAKNRHGLDDAAISLQVHRPQPGGGGDAITGGRHPGNSVGAANDDIVVGRKNHLGKVVGLGGDSSRQRILKDNYEDFDEFRDSSRGSSASWIYCWTVVFPASAIVQLVVMAIQTCGPI